jgi:transcriptional antiterminator NusG
MSFYVIQVQGGIEHKFLGVARRMQPELALRLLWPRRQLKVRRNGKWFSTLAPIFPGYMFVQLEKVETDTYWNLKRLPGFLRFLESNTNIVPLNLSDTALLQHFLSFGEVVGSSAAWFDEDKRIRVISGPLKGMEGRIVRVDRRKGRARVRLELYEESFHIDFAFHALEPEREPAANGP